MLEEVDLAYQAVPHDHERGRQSREQSSATREEGTARDLTRVKATLQGKASRWLCLAISRWDATPCCSV
jgi:hypothetical protein